MNIFQEGTFRIDWVVMSGKQRRVYIDGVNRMILTPKEFEQAKKRYEEYIK